MLNVLTSLPHSPHIYMVFNNLCLAPAFLSPEENGNNLNETKISFFIFIEMKVYKTVLFQIHKQQKLIVNKQQILL